jgi:hypothetical protein
MCRCVRRLAGLRQPPEAWPCAIELPRRWTWPLVAGGGPGPGKERSRSCRGSWPSGPTRSRSGRSGSRDADNPRLQAPDPARLHRDDDPTRHGDRRLPAVPTVPPLVVAPALAPLAPGGNDSSAGPRRSSSHPPPRRIPLGWSASSACRRLSGRGLSRRPEGRRGIENLTMARLVGQIVTLCSLANQKLTISAASRSFGTFCMPRPPGCGHDKRGGAGAATASESQTESDGGVLARPSSPQGVAVSRRGCCGLEPRRGLGEGAWAAARVRPSFSREALSGGLCGRC